MRTLRLGFSTQNPAAHDASPAYTSISSTASPESSFPTSPTSHKVPEKVNGHLIDTPKPRTVTVREQTEELRRLDIFSTDIIVGSEPAIVETILEGAGSAARRGVLDALKLGHLPAWRRQEHWAAVIPQFQLALQRVRGESPFNAGWLLSTWWGRRAVDLFAGTALQQPLESLSLAYRLTRARKALLSEGTDEQHAAQATLATLESAPELLDQVFASMLKGTLEWPLRGAALGIPTDIYRPAETADAPSTQKVVAPPYTLTKHPEPNPLAVPVSRLVADHAELERSNDTARPPVNEPPSAEESSSFVSPTAALDVPDSTLPSSFVHGELMQLRDAVERYRTLKMESAELLNLGDMSRLMECVSRLKSAREAAEESCKRFEVQLAPFGVEPPVLTEAHVTSEETAQAFLVNIADRLELARQRKIEQLAAKVAIFRAELLSVGMDVSAELDALDSLTALQALKDKLSDTIAEERTFLRFTATQSDWLRELEHLSASSRLRLYVRVASTLNSRMLPSLLACLRRDSEALEVDRAKASVVLARTATVLLDVSEPIPAGFWAMFKRAAGDTLVDALGRAGLLDRLVNCSDELVLSRELYPLIAGEHELVPAPLRNAISRFKVMQLPPAERIPRLAGLALDLDCDEPTISVLFGCLVAEGRHREALMLAAFLVRAGRPVRDTQSLKEALLIVLVESAADGQARNVIRTLVDDGEWLTSSADDVAVLLYLAASTETREWYDAVRYRYAAALELAGTIRPVLVRRWLQGGMLADDTPEQRRRQEELIKNAKDVMDQWEHDIQKRSCYSGWEFYAQKYQLVFKHRLSHAMDLLLNGAPVPELSPDGLIQEGVSTGLPPVEGDGRKAMLQHLAKQLERLTTLTETAQQLGGGTALKHALRPPSDLRADLALEAERDCENRVLSKIYRIALGSLDAR